jgi:hypothetical protein
VTTTNGSPEPIRVRRRIGLWGAPTSGKSTFLAALSIAVSKSAQDLLIYGATDESTEFLVQNTTLLTRQRRFPPPTKIQSPLSWTIHVQTQVPVRGRFGRQTMETVPLQFNMDLLDQPGGDFASVPEMQPDSDGVNLGFENEDSAAGTASSEEEMLDRLAGCDGLLLLFDPTREWSEDDDGSDSYQYFHGTLLRIAQRRLGGRGQPEMKLPHYVAVCVTKFDDPAVYRRAEITGYRSYTDDPNMFPHVKADDAAAFFADLCRNSRVGNANLVASALPRYFNADHIQYFITSAIGFNLSEGATRFQDQDPLNVTTDGNGELRIRGPIYPINVVEPLLWLGQCLARTDTP